MWHTFSDNPLAIISLYNIVPELRSVRIAGITLQRRDPEIKLLIDLPSFPDKPPQKWKGLGYNTAQMELNLYLPNSVEIVGWSSKVVVDIDFEQTQKDMLCIRANSQLCRLNIVYRAMRIGGFSGYFLP